MRHYAHMIAQKNKNIGIICNDQYFLFFSYFIPVLTVSKSASSSAFNTLKFAFSSLPPRRLIKCYLFLGFVKKTSLFDRQGMSSEKTTSVALMPLLHRM